MTHPILKVGGGLPSYLAQCLANVVTALQCVSALHRAAKTKREMSTALFWK